MEQKTFVYKTVEGLGICAEVFWVAESATPRPVVVSIHGGALMGGRRVDKLQRLGERLVEAGYAIVDIDYRLAPETKIGGIIEDVRDAHRWVREAGPGLFGADPGRVATMGGSAGGYLTLVAGYVVEPRPRALVSFYGYGDIAGPWYSEPSEFYQKVTDLVTEEQARAVVGTTPVTEPPEGMAMERLKFYTWCRQQGRWPQEVSGGLDPHTQDAAYTPFCPERNVTAQYPPTILLHGQKDTDVPWEQSARMAEALAAAGVEHELALYPEGFHCFDYFWQAEQIREAALNAQERAFRFLESHMRIK